MLVGIFCVFGAALDLVVRHAAARLGGAVGSANFCVGRQLAERSPILLGQYVANVEHPRQRRTLCRSASDQDLTHGRRQVNYVGLVVAEPLS